MNNLILPLLLAIPLAAQPLQQYDVLQFRQPAGKREESKEVLTFSTVQGRAFCQFALYHSLPSKGDGGEDFRAEWEQIGKLHYVDQPLPKVSAKPEAWKDGWSRFEVRVELDNPKYGGAYSVRHQVLTGNGRRTSVFVRYNEASKCAAQADAFFASLTPVAAAVAPVSAASSSAPPATAVPATPGGYQYTATEYKDGWVATEYPDWVQAARGDSRILIHHKSPDLRDILGQHQTTHVWDILVAPRYANLANLWVRRGSGMDGFKDRQFAEADVTERATGRRVHVSLYRGGNGQRWIEFITPTKEAFIKQFTPVYADSGTNWDFLDGIARMNRFTVAAKDLQGKWTTSSGSGIEYVNAYTGQSVGMASASSTADYVFAPDGTYTSNWRGVDSFNGSNRYGGEKYKGNYSVNNNQQLQLTNRFQGRTDTFNVYFEAVKGGRVLHLFNPGDGSLHSTLIRVP
jgi:hypothetical protein